LIGAIIMLARAFLSQGVRGLLLPVDRLILRFKPESLSAQLCDSYGQLIQQCQNLEGEEY